MTLLTVLFLTVPALVLAVQCLMAVFPGRRAPLDMPVRVAVVIPVMHRSDSIEHTLNSLAGQLGANDEVVIVSTQRPDPGLRDRAPAFPVRWVPCDSGASRATLLDAAASTLALSYPVDVVIVVEPNCEVSPGTVGRLAQRAVATGRVVQSSLSTDFTAKNDRAFARLVTLERIESHMRPLGSSRLGLPCTVHGGATAVPWPRISADPTLLGRWFSSATPLIAMTAAGCAPLFDPRARVERDGPPRRRRVSALSLVSALLRGVIAPRLDRGLARLGGATIALAYAGQLHSSSPVQLWWLSATLLTVFAVGITWLRFTREHYGFVAAVTVPFSLMLRGALSFVTPSRTPKDAIDEQPSEPAAGEVPKEQLRQLPQPSPEPQPRKLHLACTGCGTRLAVAPVHERSRLDCPVCTESMALEIDGAVSPLRARVA